MTPPLRDDCPPEYNLLRRHFIGGSAAVLGLAAAPLSAAALADTVPAIPVSKFMEVSSLLINHALNPEVGGRLAAAMVGAHPGLEQNIDDILTIARGKNAKVVEDFYQDVPQGNVQDTALAIISAWYSGVISETLGSEVYAYELALMYQPTSDVMTIPSYAISGPNGWDASPRPPLGDMPEF
jgi:fructose 5-dehydrogenase small subunit